MTFYETIKENEAKETRPQLGLRLPDFSVCLRRVHKLGPTVRASDSVDPFPACKRETRLR